MSTAHMHVAGGSPGPLATAEREREREYSPSSCIGGDYRPFIEAYATRSAAARSGAEALGARWSRRAYGPGAAQGLELCLPPAGAAVSKGAGLLVFIHGGYWQELSARDSLFSAAHCVAAGLAFAAIDYTLAPQASVSAIVSECRLALAWLFEHATDLGIDAANVVAAGSSAGAHLAAMVSLPMTQTEQTAQSAQSARHSAHRPCAAVLVSGVYALEPLVGTSINDALGLDIAAAQAVSPRLHPLQGFPPALVCWGEIETQAFKAQGQDFAGALREAGASCTDFEVPARNHFDVILDLADPHTLLGQRTLALFRERRD